MNLPVKLQSYLLAGVVRIEVTTLPDMIGQDTADSFSYSLKKYVVDNKVKKLFRTPYL